MQKLSIVVMTVLLMAGCAKKDDTDPPGGVSGMVLLTDSGTGCQYRYRSAGLSPRVAADGKRHMGCKEAAK